MKKEQRHRSITGLELVGVGGRSCPVFRCQTCGQLIRNAKEAMLVRGDDDLARVVHKRCDPSQERYPCSMELNVISKFLGENIGIKDTDYKEIDLELYDW